MAKGIIDCGREKERAVRERGSWGLSFDDKEKIINAGEIAVFSPEYWGEDYLDPQGFFDGDAGPRQAERRSCPGAQEEVCDIYGNQILQEVYSSDELIPDENWDEFWEDIPSDEDEIAEAQPEEPVYVTGYENYGVDTQTSSMKLTQKEHDDPIFSEYDDEYAFPRILSSSPIMACNYGRPNNEGYEPKAYFRWDHPRGCRYKNQRKGGGRLSRRKSRSLADLFSGFTSQLFVPPRVAVVNGTPEEFRLTRRHLVKKLKEAGRKTA